MRKPEIVYRFRGVIVFNGLGSALRFLREKRSKSQKQVAADAGITPPMLSAYENGRTNPELDTLDKILHDGLGASLSELDRALDVVNDRVEPHAPLRAPAAGSPLAWIPEGRTLSPALEEGYAEIVRGLTRISRHVFDSVVQAAEEKGGEG